MPDQTKPTPVETLRDGRLKATTWENEGKDGNYYTVTLAKTYEDKNGQLQDSHSFTGSELLRIAELARESHALIRDLRRTRAREADVAEPSVDRSAERSSSTPQRFRNRGVSR